jgi:mycothione reductase
MRKRTERYHVIVVGSGSGAAIVDSALNQGLSVALVDRGPLGGTCLNVGCIPTKILVAPADRIVEIREAKKLGIDARVESVDFGAIVRRMRRLVGESRDHMERGIQLAQDQGLGFFDVEGFFVDENILQVGDRRIRGERFFLSCGARPFIPPIPGLESADYLTNESVLQLDERPESLAIIGGGYISVEFAHFFAALGTRVTIVQRNPRLVPGEEPEISELLKHKLAERMEVHTGTEVIRVERNGDGYRLFGQAQDSEAERQVEAARILVAAGRRSNADLLRVADAGIETDGRGYIRVNDYLETNRDNVWAFGDVTGRYMFRHVANREAVYAWHNSMHREHKAAMDYNAIPHAVFSYPQLAAVGLTEEQARGRFDILVGTARYADVAKGEALMEEDGFAKAVVERESGSILGFHIVGPYAAMLIQEVITMMANKGTVNAIAAGMHIHPAMPELIGATLANLHEPD